MARFPKPAEGSWTEHYPELGTGPVSYEDSINPEIYELERKAIFKRAWLNVGRIEQLPRKGNYFTKELDGRQHLDHRGAHRQRRGEGVPQHLPAPRQQAGVERHAAGRDQRRLPAVHLQVPRLALRPGRQPDLRPAGGGVLRPRQEPLRTWCRCTARCGKASSSSTSPTEPEQSLTEFLGPMITDLAGYPFEQADLAVPLPLRGQGELEALHGRVPGVLSRTDPAREPVADVVLQGRGRGRVRGTALPDRRAAPAW